MNIDSLIEILDAQLIENQEKPLNAPEVMILKGVAKYLTYTKIALEGGYSAGYFTNVVAPELYKKLSLVIGQRITKKNCIEKLDSYVKQRAKIGQSVAAKKREELDIQTSSFSTQDSDLLLPGYPSGSVAVDSPFYIPRPPTEEQAYEEIEKPGALVRIKAPQEMGKTSLLLKILHYANRRDFHTVRLNLQQVDDAILNDLNRFLRWLCANVSRQLKLEPTLDEYWDEDIGSKISCTLYFQEYLLEQINKPFVLALDEVQKIFEHPKVAKDVLPLLRSWYEEAKRIPTWKKLRLIVVHSTEIYVPLQLKQSPFNVGLPIQLDSFNFEQVKQLSERYQIEWQEEQDIQKLMDIVGGHPALVNIALYHLSQKEITIEELLETASTSNGIYENHLQRHWTTLQEQPELAQALNLVLKENEPVSLEPTIAHKLSSIGLIKQSGNKAVLGCDLYRQFFIKSYLN